MNKMCLTRVLPHRLTFISSSRYFSCRYFFINAIKQRKGGNVQLLQNQMPILYRCTIRCKSSVGEDKKANTAADGFEDLDKPIKYTTSKASEWTATLTHGGSMNAEMPSIQPYVVSFSAAIFLIYFLALREESDIDQDMGKPLYERVPGLEQQQLQIVREYNQQHGISNEEIDNRIKQLKT